MKFTERGGVRVEMAAEEPASEAVPLRVTVADTGVGIPQELQEAVFRDFSQADGSSTRRFGGLGLGLSICRSLVGLMGGRIGCHSVVGEGSSFRAILPFARSAAEQAAPLTAVERCLAPLPPVPVAKPGDSAEQRPLPAPSSRTCCGRCGGRWKREDFLQLQNAASTMKNIARNASANRRPTTQCACKWRRGAATPGKPPRRWRDCKPS